MVRIFGYELGEIFSEIKAPFLALVVINIIFPVVLILANFVSPTVANYVTSGLDQIIRWIVVGLTVFFAFIIGNRSYGKTLEWGGVAFAGFLFGFLTSIFGVIFDFIVYTVYAFGFSEDLFNIIFFELVATFPPDDPTFLYLVNNLQSGLFTSLLQQYSLNTCIINISINSGSGVGVSLIGAAAKEYGETELRIKRVKIVTVS